MPVNTQPAIPDVPVNTTKTQNEELYELKGIFISGSSQRVALINSSYVKEGDQFGLDHVDVIDKNTVVLSRPGQKRTLYLFK